MRSGVLYSEQRLLKEMGGPGRAAFKYGSDRAGASAQLAPRAWVGGIHGRSHPDPEQPGSADGVYPVGKAGPVETGDAYASGASDSGGAASQPLLGIQGLFRQPPVQQDQ